VLGQAWWGGVWIRIMLRESTSVYVLVGFILVSIPRKESLIDVPLMESVEVGDGSKGKEEGAEEARGHKFAQQASLLMLLLSTQEEGSLNSTKKGSLGV
jgi:hypothetical protein